MAKSARKAAWQRPGSPIGRKGARKAHSRYKRNMREPWSTSDVRMLRQLARQNTPTGVISLKMGRTLPSSPRQYCEHWLFGKLPHAGVG